MMKVLIVKCMLPLIMALLTVAVYSQAPRKFLLHFDFDKYNLSSPDKTVLDSIIKFNAAAPQQIKLFGHTDAIGNNGYNDQLSVKRVNTAKNYLLDHGIPHTSIVTDSGMGKRKPLNNNADKLERMANRRVEIILTKPSRSLYEKIKDTATHVGTHIILQNLNFIGNRHTLIPESWPILLELLQVMRKNPGLEVQIEGHVCCTGGREGYDEDAKALMLSTNRAVYVYNYLVANGIDKKRLSWKAYGNSRPLYPFEDSPEKRMQNRRVEIKIVKM